MYSHLVSCDTDDDQHRYEVEPRFRSIFSDGRYTRYRVAMAYLGHRWGVELLECALRRGATVELLLPARANVYSHENVRAAQTLLAAGWPTLRLSLSPDMVHAKATLAWGPEDAAAFLGSANLVRGSLKCARGVDSNGTSEGPLHTHPHAPQLIHLSYSTRAVHSLPVHTGLLPYDELNLLVQAPATAPSHDGAGQFCRALNASIGELFASAQPVESVPALRANAPWYSQRRAMWEELWQ